MDNLLTYLPTYRCISWSPDQKTNRQTNETVLILLGNVVRNESHRIVNSLKTNLCHSVTYTRGTLNYFVFYRFPSVSKTGVCLMTYPHYSSTDGSLFFRSWDGLYIHCD